MKEDHSTTGQGGLLPLTEHVIEQDRDEPVNEAMIRRLVDAFYDDIRRDDLLGPIFARHIADWSLHLPKMYAFWSTIVLQTGQYSGRPLEAHQRLPGLTHAHFDRWLKLWSAVVSRIIPTESREVFTTTAERMAVSMASQIVAF